MHAWSNFHSSRSWPAAGFLDHTEMQVQLEPDKQLTKKMQGCTLSCTHFVKHNKESHNKHALATKKSKIQQKPSWYYWMPWSTCSKSQLNICIESWPKSVPHGYSWKILTIHSTIHDLLCLLVFVEQGVMHGFKAGHTHMHVEATHTSSSTARMQLYYA